MSEEIPPQNQLEQTKVRIIQKIYLAILIISVLSLFYTLYIFFEFYIFKTSSSEKLDLYHYLDLIIFPLIIISYPFVKKYPKFFTLLFLLMNAFILSDSDMIKMGVGMPIFFSAFLIKPIASFLTAIYFIIQGSFMFYFRDHIPFTSKRIYEEYFVFYGFTMLISLIAFIVSKQFYKTFSLYETQNKELEEAKKKLSQKVENQTQKIENIESEKEKLNNKIKDMKTSLDQLKWVTQRSDKSMEK